MYKNGKGYLMSFDGDNAELVAVDESFNEVVVTWFTLDSDFAKNEVVALDPEFGVTIRFNSTDTAHQAILDARYSVADREKAIVITDPLHGGGSGSTITFTGELTSISEPRQTDDIIEMDVTVKMKSEPVIAAVT